jgi:flagella basal body P-ring formation protein FlgA
MMRALIALTTLFMLAAPAAAQEAPVLRASVTVSGDVVRIGDFVSNAGAAASIAIFRAPDPGSAGSLPVEQVLAALRNHSVIGVDTQDIRDIEVTRTSREVAEKDVRDRIARALAGRNGFSEAADIVITFDRDLPTLQFDAAAGPIEIASLRFSPGSRRFDALFTIASDPRNAPLRLRFTGTAVDTAEIAVLARNIERGDVIRASDVTIERRPRSELQNDSASQTQALGMAVRRAMRSGQPLRLGDLAKPEIVQREQPVTIMVRMPGIHLTIRGKAIDSGSDGDVVNVMNLQTKRVVQGTVIGPGQVLVATPASRLATASLSTPTKDE